jgi:putative transposase
VEPRAAVIDSQSAETTGVGGPARGYDGAQRVKGRKRHTLVDALGRPVASRARRVRPRRRRAGVAFRDRAGARMLADAAAPRELPRLALVWADQGYTGPFTAWLQEARGRSRRLSRDYGRLPATSEAVIYGPMSRLVLRRLARTPGPVA